jgi:hypothetical protein
LRLRRDDARSGGLSYGVTRLRNLVELLLRQRRLARWLRCLGITYGALRRRLSGGLGLRCWYGLWCGLRLGGLLHVPRRRGRGGSLRGAFNAKLLPKRRVFLLETLGAFALVAEIRRLLCLKPCTRHRPISRSERAYESLTKRRHVLPSSEPTD